MHAHGGNIYMNIYLFFSGDNSKMFNLEEAIYVLILIHDINSNKTEIHLLSPNTGNNIQSCTMLTTSLHYDIFFSYDKFATSNTFFPSLYLFVFIVTMFDLYHSMDRVFPSQQMVHFSVLQIIEILFLTNLHL